MLIFGKSVDCVPTVCGCWGCTLPMGRMRCFGLSASPSAFASCKKTGERCASATAAKRVKRRILTGRNTKTSLLLVNPYGHKKSALQEALYIHIDNELYRLLGHTLLILL